jgi:hypothetical protein
MRWNNDTVCPGNYQAKPNPITYATVIRDTGNNLDSNSAHCAEGVLCRMYQQPAKIPTMKPPIAIYNAVIIMHFRGHRANEFNWQKKGGTVTGRNGQGINEQNAQRVHVLEQPEEVYHKGEALYQDARSGYVAQHYTEECSNNNTENDNTDNAHNPGQCLQDGEGGDIATEVVHLSGSLLLCFLSSLGALFIGTTAISVMNNFAGKTVQFTLFF